MCDGEYRGRGTLCAWVSLWMALWWTFHPASSVDSAGFLDLQNGRFDVWVWVFQIEFSSFSRTKTTCCPLTAEQCWSQDLKPLVGLKLTKYNMLAHGHHISFATVVNLSVYIIILYSQDFPSQSDPSSWQLQVMVDIGLGHLAALVLSWVSWCLYKTVSLL